jgi:uncharacterized membrane protein
MTSASLRWTAASDDRSELMPRYLVLIAWCAIIFGVVFRVSQLPTRALFLDEAITQIRVAGHTAAELKKAQYDGQLRTVRELRRDAAVTAASTPKLVAASLAEEDAQHPPLFYVIELAFVRVLGNSLLSWRIVPAIFGILVLPAAYLLARTLFAESRAGLMAAAVFAVSPIERVYSDQAREYSLLTLLVLLATLAAVWAMRTNSFRAWMLYALLAAAGLYANPFMAYTLAAHAVFVVGFGWGSRRIGAFVGAAGLAILLYAPWLYELVIHRNDIASTNVWSAAPWPFARLAVKWVFNTGSTFFDLEYIDLRWALVLAPVVVLALIAIVRAFRDANLEARWCLGAAIAVPALLLVAPDILLGEHRSSVARYGLPVCAMLAVAVARGITGRPFAATVILAAGLVSCAVSALHPSWWDNDVNADDRRLAAIVNRVPNAQVVSSMSPPEFVTFAQVLDDDVRVSLSRNMEAAPIPKAEPVFVLRPAASDLARLEKRTGITFVAVPFVRTATAHDIGLRIGNGAAEAGTADLYRSTTGR